VVDPGLPPVTSLVGGVSELLQGDLDLGRVAVERLRAEDLGPGVVVEDLHYGAVAVAQRLAELRPQLLVLVSAVARDRPPGSVTRNRVDPPPPDPARAQVAVSNAVTGYVHPDLVVEVAAALGVLPARTVGIEVEPQRTGPGQGLSAAASEGLHTALALARAEVRRAPLLALADTVRPLVAGDRLATSPALRTVRDLLTDLEQLDRHGRWGRCFQLVDRLKVAISTAPSSEGMDHRDWGLWWALVEEVERLRTAEAAADAP